MITTLLYGIGILFTPGPVTLLCINEGFKKRFRTSVGFFFGVGLATFLLFIIYGYTGEKLVKKEYLLYISILGSLYILFLAYKISTHSTDFHKTTNIKGISFKDGFLIQFFNPKASLAALPIATINFPANNINGINIFLISLAFLVLGVLSPGTYCLVGQFFSKAFDNNRILWIFNKLMALILVYVSINIFIDHVYLVFVGINPY